MTSQFRIVKRFIIVMALRRLHAYAQNAGQNAENKCAGDIAPAVPERATRRRSGGRVP